MKDKIIDKLLVKKRNVFLTGGAGTGKTFLLNEILGDKRVSPIVLASTGMAANLIGGVTVHRFFSFGLIKSLDDLIVWDQDQQLRYSKANNLSLDRVRSIFNRRLLSNLKGKNVIVIDEISMLSSDVIDMIYYRLSTLDLVIPILFVGDFFQLPPVKNISFAFESKNWDVDFVELSVVRRTENVDFADVQLKIRLGILDEGVLDYLDFLGKNKYDKDGVHLFSVNRTIDKFNLEKLKDIKGQAYKFTAVWDRGKYSEQQVDAFIKELLISKDFKFKFGAKVIFLVNNYLNDVPFYNGEGGIIESYKDGLLLVRKDNGEKVHVGLYKFQRINIVDGKIKVICEVEQFPLRVGYAMSIHKSQGLSLSAGHIDCRNIFLAQQFYVGLSRFMNPNLVSINGFRKELVQVNQVVLDYYSKNL